MGSETKISACLKKKGFEVKWTVVRTLGYIGRERDEEILMIRGESGPFAPHRESIKQTQECWMAPLS